MDELGGEACCVASRTLTCTAVEVVQLCTVDCPPLLPHVDNRQPGQPVHVLLKTLRDPELVGTSSSTGMCVVCTFDLFVCKVLCFQRVCFLFYFLFMYNRFTEYAHAVCACV